MEPIEKLMASGREKSAFELLRASGRLPSPKGVATRVIQLTGQDEVSIPELARAISGDPAFVGRVIKAANGMLHGTRRPVLSVAEALMVLGVPAVRTLATGFSLLSDHRNGRCRGFDYAVYWSHSIALALGMQVVVAHTRAAASDEAFSLGLLLRVGELALATVYPDEYSALLEQPVASHAELIPHEKAAFAIHHGELGGEMLEHWGVPAIFTQVARHFDAPDAADFEVGSRRRSLLESTQLARLFADFCVARSEEARLDALECLQRRGEEMGIPREESLPDCARMFVLWVEWIALLELEPGVSLSFPDIALPERRVPPATGGGAARSERRRERSAIALGTDKPVVLVVDADSKHRRQVVELLASEDCSVVESADVGDALSFALELQPHMMVLGCVDAGRETVERVSSLRRTSTGRVMHLLLRMVDHGEEALIEVLEAGGDDALPVGAAPRLLLARLRAGLREVRLQRELEHDRQELHGFAAQLAITNRRLRDMALTDPLTGFRNRRYAMDRIEQEWAVADRSSRPLSCMVVDVDFLKEINDSFGHDAGDRALTQVALTLRKALRVQDVICRIGGDEFLVICPGADGTAVLTGAERARRAIHEDVIDFGGVRTRLSVSIGVATIDPAVADASALVKLADRGAYAAKQAGRNAVRCVQDA